MQWTDQIRRVKIFLVLAAVIIAVASLVVSHILIRDLAREEHNKMAVWAEAMRTLNNAGAKSVTLVATHGLLSGPAVERLKNCGAREIVLTDTVPVPEEKRLPNMTVLSVAPLLAAGLVSVRELRRCEKVYTITDAGLDALQAPDAAPSVAAPQQSNIFASVLKRLDQLGEWPVASLRGCHPNIRSRGF